VIVFLSIGIDPLPWIELNLDLGLQYVSIGAEIMAT
jgi:hypothetical protein